MWKLILLLLVICTISLWFIVATYPDHNLHIIACDVGQGDGILIYQETTQIIIDGGPGNMMATCLDRHIPFWDRTIEIVMNTHPQADHYEGLIEILARYNVQVFTANSLNADAPQYRLLEDLVGREGGKVLNPTAGMVFRSNLIQLDILHPSKSWLSENSDRSRDVTNGQVLGVSTSLLDPNEFSIISTLHYKNFDALFTGDTQEDIEHLLVQDGIVSDIEYLKVPHHGSKNGLTKEFLDAVTPEIAVISDGKNNTYGHPHKEILDMLETAQVKILRTDQVGDVEVVSDGERYWINDK